MSGFCWALKDIEDEAEKRVFEVAKNITNHREVAKIVNISESIAYRIMSKHNLIKTERRIKLLSLLHSIYTETIKLEYNFNLT